MVGELRGWLAALGVLCVACASPEDAFVGRYAGTYACSGAFDDGTPYTEGPVLQTIEIARGTDGSVFLAGAQCTRPLRVVSFTRAEYVPSVCNATLENGTRVVATLESGIMDLDEPYLSYEVNILIEPEGIAGYLAAHCSFDGTRVE